MDLIELSYAKNHFPELLKRVKNGEKIVITQGKNPIAKLVPVMSRKKRRQLELEKIALHKITHTLDTFTPVSDTELQELGLL